MKLAIFSVIYLSFFVTTFSIGQTKSVRWSNEEALDLDLSKPNAIENLAITITEIKSIDIVKLTFDCSALELSNKALQVKDHYSKNSESTTIKFNDYFKEIEDFEKQLQTKAEEFNIDIVIQGKLKNQEEPIGMKIVINVKPDSSNKTPKSGKIQLFLPPIPNFSSSKLDIAYTKSQRILLIDGTGNIKSNRGFQLLGLDRTNTESDSSKMGSDTSKIKSAATQKTSFIRKKSLPVNKSLTVFAKDISFEGLKSININLNSTEYSYNAGVNELLSLQQDPIVKDTSKIEEAADAPGKEEPDEATKIKNHLKATVMTLDKVEFMNIMDLKRLEFYKTNLKESINPFEDLLDSMALSNLFLVLNFQPAYVNLTPFPLTVPNADEVTVESVLTFESTATEEKHTTGVFRTSHSMTVRVGSSLFATGLRNNAIYTETVEIEGQEELRATMEKDDQLSIGVGVNAEVSWRTGAIVRPNLNLAFFVPFDEEITPFVGVGPGISFYDKNVSLNLSVGWAFGNINSINEQYVDKDLSQITDLTNTMLVKKVWKSDWYVGFGLGFNLNSDD